MERILILEDEIELAENLKFFLEEEGYQVESVQDGESAVQAAEEKILM